MKAQDIIASSKNKEELISIVRTTLLDFAKTGDIRQAQDLISDLYVANCNLQEFQIFGTLNTNSIEQITIHDDTGQYSNQFGYDLYHYYIQNQYIIAAPDPALPIPFSGEFAPSGNEM